jgi:hypothetical protein
MNSAVSSPEASRCGLAVRGQSSSTAVVCRRTISLYDSLGSRTRGCRRIEEGNGRVRFNVGLRGAGGLTVGERDQYTGIPIQFG